jgi:serine phosphatase RsbU (regulator of sigma subunit)
VKTSGETAWLESGETPLGWGTGHVRCDHFVDLTGAWSLILYSDGIVEAGRDIVKGLERLKKVVENQDLKLSKDLLPRLVEQSLVGPPHDDIAMLAVTFVR